jgi:glycerate-2-kinase
MRKLSLDELVRKADTIVLGTVTQQESAWDAQHTAISTRVTLAVERMLVITKDGHTDPALDLAPGVTQLQSAHPVPDLRSFSNGAELEERVRSLREGIFPLFLISGGSSSLVEALRDGVSLGEVQALNEQGLASGWDIARLNIARARLSRIKGGGIARLLRERRALALFISDVPGDDPDVIGSGLLGHDVGIADGIERHVIATNETAVRAVQDGARAHGLDFEAVSTRFDGDVGAVTAGCLARQGHTIVGVDVHLHGVGHEPDGAKAGLHRFLCRTADHAGEVGLGFE